MQLEGRHVGQAAALWHGALWAEINTHYFSSPDQSPLSFVPSNHSSKNIF